MTPIGFRERTEACPLCAAGARLGASSTYDIVARWGTDSHFLDPLQGFRRLVDTPKPGGGLAFSYQHLDHWLRQVFPGIKASRNAVYNLTGRSVRVLPARLRLIPLAHRTEGERFPVDSLFRVTKVEVPTAWRKGVHFLPTLSFRLVIARQEA